MADPDSTTSLTGSTDTTPVRGTVLREVPAVLGLITGLILISSAAWGRPVTSMEMNRNDAAFYLVLGHHLVEHGVYSHSQTAPFIPHTEWPPGIPLLYALPLLITGGFPLAGSSGLLHVWIWLVAATAICLLYRYLRLFCRPGTAWTVAAVTIASRAFLDEAQAAFADIPALAAAAWALREIELHFRSPHRSRTRSALMYGGMSLLPLVKPYLGIVFVAYLWNLLVRWWRTVDAAEPDDIRPARHGALMRGIGSLAVCCLPFAGFMTYSVMAAEQSGTISAVTWLVTDNPVLIREGVQAADQKTAGEWLATSVSTLRYHLVYHVTSALLPALDWLDFTHWPASPRILVMGLMWTLLILGSLRMLRRGHGAPVVYTAAMLAVFAVLGCDSARYFVILTPLCAWLELEGLAAVKSGLHAGTAALNRIRRSQSARVSGIVVPAELSAPLLSVCCLAALAASALWVQRQATAPLDPNPFYAELYQSLFELRDRDDVQTIVVPFPLRELTIVETGRRVLTYSDALADRAMHDPSTAVIRLRQSDLRTRPGFVAPAELEALLDTPEFRTVIGAGSDRLCVVRPDAPAAVTVSTASR